MLGWIHAIKPQSTDTSAGLAKSLSGMDILSYILQSKSVLVWNLLMFSTVPGTAEPDSEPEVVNTQHVLSTFELNEKHPPYGLTGLTLV